MDKKGLYIQYSGVNRTVHYTEALTQAAAPNSEYEAHVHHDFFEIYWFLDGKLSFAFEGDRIAVAPGDMLILCSNLLHRPIIQEPCRYHRKRILFHKEIFVRLGEGGYTLQQLLLGKQALKFHAGDICRIGLDRLFGEIGQALEEQTDYGDFAANVLLMHFLIAADKACQWCASGQSTLQPGKVHEIIRYIDNNLTGDLSYRAIGQQFHISEKSLYKLFRQETGFSLGRYIRERRIIKAKSLLNAGSGAFDAAADTGFQDYSVFYRSFTKALGISPAQYAKNKGSD